MLSSSNVSPETERQIRAIKEEKVTGPWIEEFENEIHTE
jgi:hypothetical protein